MHEIEQMEEQLGEEERIIQIAEKVLGLVHYSTIMIRTEKDSDLVNVFLISIGHIFIGFIGLKMIKVSRETRSAVNETTFCEILSTEHFTVQGRNKQKNHHERFSQNFKSIFELDGDTCGGALWRQMKTKCWFVMKDRTIHEDDCTDQELMQLPLLTATDLICSCCAASVDIEWDTLSYSVPNYIPIYMKSNRIVWRMWNCYNNSSFIEWISEEVLKDIFEIVLMRYKM